MAAAASGGVGRYRTERRVGPEAEGSVGRGVKGREGKGKWLIVYAKLGF